MVNDDGELGWLRHLPEAGKIAALADREKAMLDERADLVAQINALDHRLSRLRNEALGKARAIWTAAEISTAQQTEAS